MTDYKALSRSLESLVSGSGHAISNLANASSFIYNSLDDLNWAGFYLMEGDKLVLGPFMGKPACIEIPVGRGVCGTAALEKRTLLVPDVHKFPGHIACDGASNSEIVIPLYSGDEVIGVLDIDSPLFSRFSQDDKEGLEALAHIIEKNI